MDDAERKKIADDFAEAVNMTPSQLAKWLESEDSKSVGYAAGENKSSPGGKESVGHSEGRRIVEIKGKSKGDLTDDDYAHMRKVVGYVHRHMAQKPKGDSHDSRWRHSLMNWRHDPEKA